MPDRETLEGRLSAVQEMSGSTEMYNAISQGILLSYKHNTGLKNFQDLDRLLTGVVILGC
jgi:hypothetical protein